MRVIKYLVLSQVGSYFVWFHTEFAVVIIKCQTITEKKIILIKFRLLRRRVKKLGRLL